MPRKIYTQQPMKAPEPIPAATLGGDGSPAAELSDLTNAEQAYRLVIEGMNEGAVSVSSAGTVLYCNRQFAAMVENSVEKVVGSPLERFVESSQQLRLREMLARLPAAGDKAEFSLTSDGPIRKGVPVLLSLRPLELEGGRVISIVATDLSTRKQYEQWLRRQNLELERRVTDRTAELTRANAELELAKTKLTENARDLEKVIAERTLALQESISSLEEFCYTIAHDLRAPLRTMHGFSSALLEDFAASLNPAARDYAQRIVRAASRMDEQIRALLTYGRLNSTEMPLIPTDLAALLERLAQSEEFRDAQITLLPPLPEVLANPTALRQVLDNLIGNAVKFVAPGVLPRLEISAQETGGWVRVTVRDNGIGIDPKYHQRIFRVFERVSTNGYTGTGIGLAIVQKGVERMGGRVGVESSPGKGSRFWVDLRAPNSESVPHSSGH